MRYVIFCERAFDKEYFEKLKDFCRKHWRTTKVYCIAPINYELCVAEQGFAGTKEDLSNILAERYKELELCGVKINLHLHLGLKLDNINQKKMFEEAWNWMRANGFLPEFWYPGWYNYDKESIYYAQQHGLKYDNGKGAIHFHDYQLDNPFSIMNILASVRNLLR